MARKESGEEYWVGRPPRFLRGRDRGGGRGRVGGSDRDDAGDAGAVRAEPLRERSGGARGDRHREGDRADLRARRPNAAQGRAAPLCAWCGRRATPQSPTRQRVVSMYRRSESSATTWSVSARIRGPVSWRSQPLQAVATCSPQSISVPKSPRGAGRKGRLGGARHTGSAEAGAGVEELRPARVGLRGRGGPRGGRPRRRWRPCVLERLESGPVKVTCRVAERGDECGRNGHDAFD
jgi:hypothetical protein